MGELTPHGLWVGPWKTDRFLDMPVLRASPRKMSLCAWTTITKYHRLGSLNREMYLLTVLEVRSPRSRSCRVGFWWELSSWLPDGLFVLTWLFLEVWMWRERMSSLVSLVRALILLDEGPIFMTSFNPSYFFGSPTSKHNHIWGLGCQHRNWKVEQGERHKYSVHDQGTEREERGERHLNGEKTMKWDGKGRSIWGTLCSQIWFWSP